MHYVYLLTFERKSTAIVQPSVNFPNEAETEKEDREDAACFRQIVSDVNDSRSIWLSMHTHTCDRQC